MTLSSELADLQLVSTEYAWTDPYQRTSKNTFNHSNIYWYLDSVTK